jgi:hypothetical protein
MAEWTQEELTEAGNMLYDLAWGDEEERFRPKRENWVPRVLAGETPIRTDVVVLLGLQRNRLLTALESAVGIMPDYACDEARAAIAACTEEK